MFEIAGGIILAVLFFAALPSIVYWAYSNWDAIKTILAFVVVGTGLFVMYEVQSLKSDGKPTMQAKWEEGVREQEARYRAADAALGLAPGECAQGAFDAATNTSVCIRFAGAYDAAQYIAAVGPCMEKHNWDSDAERTCDK